MIQVGLMGGTFDPIHVGHLIAAETAREACGLDEIWFIPSAVPPLKDGLPQASAEQRLEMVQSAIDSQPHCRAMDIELARGGVSYTIDTVTELQAQNPGRTFSYIIGADRINDLTAWHRIEELASLVSFIGLERPGHDIAPAQLPPCIRERLRIARMPQLDISSTDIRKRRAEGRSIRYLVSDEVYHYIVRNDLYGS
jgi:nicotinate-nucleotide adenylyltransferase